MTERLLPKLLFDKAKRGRRGQSQARPPDRGRGKLHRRPGCAALTEIPGSSEVFEAGFVTYSNASKIDDLGVSEEVVETFGAVSVATAWAMAGERCGVEGRCRGRHHRNRRARRRHSVKAGRNGGLRPRRAWGRSFADRRRPEDLRGERPRRGSPSGGALRARAADAVKRRRALLERTDHSPQRPVEHLPGKRFEQPRPEGEIDRKCTSCRPSALARTPFVVKIFERALDIIDGDRVRPLDLEHPAGEALLERVEKPTMRSATVSSSLDERTRTATTQGRNSS
jgi:hypothetical protein